MRASISYELKKKYESYYFLKNALNTVGSNKASEKYLQTLKQEIRRLNRWDDEVKNRISDNFRAYPNDSDGGYDRSYCKYEVPYVMTADEIKQFIDEEWCHWYDPYDDGRDCTGVWFTNHINVIPIPQMNKSIVIHCKNCDV